MGSSLTKFALVSLLFLGACTANPGATDVRPPAPAAPAPTEALGGTTTDTGRVTG